MKPIFMRYPHGKTKAFTMSFDDGRLKDADIIKEMQKNGLKGTFFINTGNFGKSQHLHQNEQSAIDMYKNTGMEIGSHSCTHPDLPTVLTQKGEAGLEAEVTKDKEKLEQMFGCEVIGFAYPGAPPYKLYDDAVIEWLKNNGIKYARTAGSSEKFDLPQNWLALVPTMWVGNVNKIFELGKQFVDTIVLENPLLYYIWGHAYDITDKWQEGEFSTFCQLIGNKNDVFYATNGEIYNYVTAYQQLIFSSSDNSVTNPTNIDLWFEYNGKIYKIKANTILR